ncbi:hypothetical protein ACR78G_21485 [Sphingobacterium spiritivorum]
MNFHTPSLLPKGEIPIYQEKGFLSASAGVLTGSMVISVVSFGGNAK